MLVGVYCLIASFIKIIPVELSDGISNLPVGSQSMFSVDLTVDDNGPGLAYRRSSNGGEWEMLSMLTYSHT